MSKILVLGAGIFQIPLIQHLQRNGHIAVVASNRASDLGLSIADVAYQISITDLELLREVALKEKIEAVLTCGSELGVVAMAKLNEFLGLKSITPKLAELVANKLVWKQLLATHHIQTPKFYSCNNAAIKLSKLIVKPTFGGGSRGVECYNGAPLTDGMYLEECLIGNEIGGDFIVKNGKLQFFQTSQKKVNKHFAPVQHVFVNECNKPAGLATYLQEIIDVIGIDNAICNFDVIVNETGFYIIDLGLRIGGNALPELIFLSTGISEYDVITNMTLGRDFELNPKQSNSFFGVQILGAKHAGVLSSYSKRLEMEEGIIKKVLRFEPGQSVMEFTQGSFNCGYFIFKANTPDELIALGRSFANWEWVEVI